MGKIRRAIGLMSGTSMDGIDIALIETDGEDHVRRLAGGSVTYEPAFRERLRQAIEDARELTDRSERPGCLADVEAELTKLHAEAALRFMGDRMLQPSAIDVIGFHGQTVLHRWMRDRFAAAAPSNAITAPPDLTAPPPGRMLTIQLGDGAALALATGIDVVYDLRAEDCAAGGQGAPLVPAYHRALAARLRDRPVAFVNIGGVANITWIGADGALIAFDTGPGNALIDDWVRLRTGGDRDTDGALAATGIVHDDYVAHYLRHSHFSTTPPKSLDRNAFPIGLVDPLSTEDGAATLTALTASSIAKAREHLPAEPRIWIICGGGRRNRTLMRMIAESVENAVAPAEALHFDGDSMEAEAWGYLAVRALDGKPITFPGTTGVGDAMTGGVIARAP